MDAVRLLHTGRENDEEKKAGILDAMAFLLAVPLGVAGFALQYDACPKTKETKARQHGTKKFKENEKDRWEPVLGAPKM
jgi:hypothetical protein